MWGIHGGVTKARRRGGVGLVMAGVLLGASSAVAQQDAQQEAQRDGSGPLACYQQAEREVSLTSEQAMSLCQGAASVAPAECYAASQASATSPSTEDAIALCHCAISTEPVSCYRRAERETFLETQDILQLCSPSLAYGLLSDCRPGAYPVYPWKRGVR